MSDKYNGWTNRETWALALWVNNEQPMQEEWNALAIAADDEYELADSFKRWYDDFVDTAFETKAEDMFRMLLDIGSDWRIDWRDLAESWWRDTEQERNEHNATDDDDDDDPQPCRLCQQEPAEYGDLCATCAQRIADDREVM